MSVDPRMRKALIIGGLAVAAYLIYRWYQNKQASQNQGALGTNLNSSPNLIGGSTGPTSGLQYYAGNTTVYTTNPITQPSNSGGTNTGGTTGTDGGSSGGSSGGTVNWWQNGSAFSGTIQQFLTAFQGTGKNKGTIVPGGTGKPLFKRVKLCLLHLLSFL